MSPPPIRLLLVDDHPVLLQGLASLLGPADGFVVVATARTAPEAIAAHAATRPDLTVLDLRLGTHSGVEVLRAVRARDPAARFLVLSTFDADADVRSAVAAGAAGYLLKTAPPEALIGALRAIHAGLKVLPPGLAARLDAHQAIWELTPREQEVLEAAAQGNANKEIAKKLAITEGTVKGYLVSIFAKLDASSRTQAIAKAIAKGLVDLSRSRRPEDPI